MSSVLRSREKERRDSRQDCRGRLLTMGKRDPDLREGPADEGEDAGVGDEHHRFTQRPLGVYGWHRSRFLGEDGRRRCLSPLRPRP
jgi:hypothetical protein